ncbi:MDR family MFS transporter [Paenibacillus sp. GP183]|uniref:MDR family MFS transporter n=1 Tax=Paenibacillus sp. GP183 TaxID=1882751 RepID=UPI000897E4A5|nr:MDR family MFS transporter [Paenibacillus sp. GP183]SEB78818.1 drug resistance transporter, EmrB/QacA subfamily [Paenibacillus sp. GP183]
MSTISQTATETAPTPKQIKWIVTGLMLGLLLSSLDQTIVSTAMPTVISDLHGLALYSWVFSIYMLTSTAAVPIFGKLADLYGRRLIYLIGMGFFLAGSALCGLSHNMTELIIFRAIQGIGAGALMPIAMTIIGDIFPPDRRGKMQGIFGAVFGLSSVLGPAVGGFLVDNVNWQWIFYVNLPFGILGAIVLGTVLKESKGTEKKSIDWGGAIVLTGAVVTLLLALVLGGGGANDPGTHFPWGSFQIIGLFAASVVLIVLFIFIESRAKEPIIPLYLFKNRAITVSSIVGFFMGIGMFGAITYIPLFVQGVIGSSATQAGYILTPLMLSLIASSIIGGRIISKVSYRVIIVVSMLIMTIGFLLMSQMTLNTPNSTVVIYMIITGLGMGALMPVLTIAVQSAVSREQRGVATSSSQFFRSIGATLGVSVMGALMTNKMNAGLSDLGKSLPNIPAETLSKFANPQMLLNPQARASMPPALLEGVRGVLAHSITLVFASGVIFVLIGLLAGFFMGKERLKKSEEGTASKAEVLEAL